MSMLFLKWEEDARGVPQALFSEGCRIVAFSRTELFGLLGQLYNANWLAAVEQALATQVRRLPTSLQLDLWDQGMTELNSATG
jgi:hypothetical protein